MNHKYIVASILFLFTCTTIANAVPTKEKPLTVTIDAGHGGHDPGAIGTISKEKNINLSIALLLGKKINEKYPDVKIVYTRKTDVYLTLQERANVANNAHSNLFISIHTNANNNHSVYGCETYTLGLAKSQSNLDVAMRENSVILLEDDYKVKYEGFNPKSIDSYIMFECIQGEYLDKSIRMASQIQKNFAAIGRRDKGVRQAGFWVLHKTATPSILVEVGYISNREEEEYLNSSVGRENIAESIFKGFVSFKNEYERKSGRNSTAEIEKTTETPTETEKVAVTETVPSSVTDKKPTETTKEESPKKEPINEERAQKFKEMVAVANEAQKNKVKNDSIQKIKAEKLAEKALAEKTIESQPKPTEETKPTVTTTTVTTAESIGIEYRIQLFAVSKKLSPKDAAFKGLKAEFFTENGLYKYTYGRTKTYAEILQIKKEISDKFPSTMCIAFKNGQKISVKEALKETKK